MNICIRTHHVSLGGTRKSVSYVVYTYYMPPNQCGSHQTVPWTFSLSSNLLPSMEHQVPCGRNILGISMFWAIQKLPGQFVARVPFAKGGVPNMFDPELENTWASFQRQPSFWEEYPPTTFCWSRVPESSGCQMVTAQL